MPGLQSRSMLINKLADEQIQKPNMKIGKETIARLRLARKKADKKSSQKKRERRNMKEIIRVLKRIEKENQNGTLKLESLYDVFSDLEKKFRYEFEYFNLTSVALSYTMPLLTKSLQEWDPHKNAPDWLYKMSSWKAMLNACVWDDFVAEFIVPKLWVMFHELEVAPGKKNLGKQRVRFLWIMSWATVIPNHHMVTMMETGFFPKLQKVLYHWLCSDPNLDEVVKWYLGWKGSLTNELLDHYRVRDELNMCLEMMHQVAEGIEVVSPKIFRENRQRQFEAQQKAAAFYARIQEEAEASKRRRVTSAGDINMLPEMSLNEIVEVFAQQNQLSFKPKYGSTHNGHRVYGFGNINVCVDSANNCIIAQTKDDWSVVSLEVLLEMHRNSITK